MYILLPISRSTSHPNHGLDLIILSILNPIYVHCKLLETTIQNFKNLVGYLRQRCCVPRVLVAG